MIWRNIELIIREALTDTPAILINGARQTGKTTLVRALSSDIPKATYVTLDDPAVLAGAAADPNGFLNGLTGTIIIDEAQMVPALSRAFKMAVDEDRQPGRFILTG
jgi:hypothetical protein